MRLKYFCGIGAELKKQRINFDYMNQLYLYVLSGDETLEEVTAANFFNEVAVSLQPNDIIYIYSGSDSSYLPYKVAKDLDNNVTLTALNSGGTGTTDFIDFTTDLENPEHLEGRVFYDAEKHALSYYNDDENVTINLGQELVCRALNNSGADITNGSVIYPNATGGISLADTKYKDRSRCIAVATQDIPNGEYGYITKLGEVGGLDTSLYSVGDTVYLGTDGAFTNTKPTGENYITQVGIVRVVDAADGIIRVDTSTSELTVEVTDTNGFPEDQRDTTTISFTDGTRTFSIAPTGDEFHYYENGDKYEQTEAQTVVIPDTEGNHLIYFDGDTLTSITNPSLPQTLNLIKTKPVVARLYWDSTNQEAIYLGDERHGISMSPVTHAILYSLNGSKWVEGLALNNILVDQTGDSDTHAQFGTEEGDIIDSDLDYDIAAIASTVGFPIYYLDGANGDLRRSYNAGFPLLTTGTGRAAYNEWTGAIWQLTEVTNLQFMLLHVVATNDLDEPIKVFVGQNQYTSAIEARAGATTEIATIQTKVGTRELVFLGTTIVQTSDGYANAVKSRFRSTDTGDDYVDWRTSEIAQGSAPTSHTNLSNVEIAATGVPRGHIDNSQPLQTPELTTTQRDAVASPNEGMIIFNTTLGAYQIYQDAAWKYLFTSDEELTFLDEDDMASDSPTGVPSQQSVKYYVDNNMPTISGNGITLTELNVEVTTESYLSHRDGGASFNSSRFLTVGRDSSTYYAVFTLWGVDEDGNVTMLDQDDTTLSIGSTGDMQYAFGLSDTVAIAVYDLNTAVPRVIPIEFDPDTDTITVGTATSLGTSTGYYTGCCKFSDTQALMSRYYNNRIYAALVDITSNVASVLSNVEASTTYYYPDANIVSSISYTENDDGYFNVAYSRYTGSTRNIMSALHTCDGSTVTSYTNSPLTDVDDSNYAASPSYLINKGLTVLAHNGVTVMLRRCAPSTNDPMIKISNGKTEMVYKVAGVGNNFTGSINNFSPDNAQVIPLDYTTGYPYSSTSANVFTPRWGNYMILPQSAGINNTQTCNGIVLYCDDGVAKYSEVRYPEVSYSGSYSATILNQGLRVVCGDKLILMGYETTNNVALFQVSKIEEK